MSIKDTKKFVPEKLRTRDLNVKFTEVLDFILDKHLSELDDVKLKFRGTDQVRKEVVTEILHESGFGYISDLLDISPSVDPNSVLAFTALIALLKGHRDGFELVLDLLGIDFTIIEWWEAVPKDPVDTIKLDIDLDTSGITDFFTTFQKFKVFARQYIFPKINATFIISFDFAQKNFDFAGFYDTEVSGIEPIASLASFFAGFYDTEVSGLIT